MPISGLNSYLSGQPEPRFFDIDRVEVLRGPQGTIYGASSMGGTLHFVSNQPDLSNFSGDVHTSVGGTQGGGFNYESDSVVNLPLVTGSSALRIGALYDRESGWIDRANPNNGYQVDARGINYNDTSVVRATLKWQPNSSLTITPSVFLQRVTMGGQNYFSVTLPDFESPTLVPEIGRDEYAMSSLTVNYDFGWSNLTSVSGYFWRAFGRTIDTTDEDSLYIGQSLQQQFGFGGAAISALASPGLYDTNVNQINQELRLASKPAGPEDRWSWIGGLYYSRARTRLVDDETIPGFNSTFESIYNNTPLNVLGASFPNDLVYYASSQFVYSDYAVFG